MHYCTRNNADKTSPDAGKPKQLTNLRQLPLCQVADTLADELPPGELSMLVALLTLKLQPLGRSWR